MKKLINTEIKKARNNLSNASTREEYLKARNILDSLVLIKDSLEWKYSDKKMLLSSLLDSFDDSNQYNKKKFFNNFIDIILEYAKKPLLETEASINYPVYGSTKNMSNKVLIDIWNKVYEEEIDNPYLFHTSNTKFTKKRLFTMEKGKCIIFPNAFNGKTRLAVQRQYDERDLLNPISYGIDLAYPEKNYNLKRIMEYYMEYKAIAMFEKIGYEKVSEDLYLADYDYLVLNARIIKNLLENNNYEISNELVARILDFAYKVVAKNIASQDLRLTDFDYITDLKDVTEYSLNKVGISYNSMLLNAKEENIEKYYILRHPIK